MDVWSITLDLITDDSHRVRDVISDAVMSLFRHKDLHRDWSVGSVALQSGD